MVRKGRKPKNPQLLKDIEPSTCSICLEKIIGNESKLSCDHKFHDTCINQWIMSNVITLNNDSKKWAFLLIDPKTHGFRSSFVLGIYDSGDFPCPVCKKNFTIIHPTTISKHFDEDKVEPTEYVIKVKFASDNSVIDQFWYSQYITEIDEFIGAYVPYSVDGDDINLFNEMTNEMFFRTVHLVKKWVSERHDNEKLILHAIYCNCKNENCLGFFFAKESECPICRTDSPIPISNHAKHLTPKRFEKNQIRLSKMFIEYSQENAKSDDFDLSDLELALQFGDDNDNDDDDDDEDKFEDDIPVKKRRPRKKNNKKNQN